MFRRLDKLLNLTLLVLMGGLFLILYIKATEKPSRGSGFKGLNQSEVTRTLCDLYENNLSYLNACLKGLDVWEVDGVAVIDDQALTCPETTDVLVNALFAEDERPITAERVRRKRQATVSTLHLMSCPGHILSTQPDIFDLPADYSFEKSMKLETESVSE